MSGFDRLHPALRHHVVNSLGWRELRPVQEQAVDAFLDGANLVERERSVDRWRFDPRIPADW